jgi:BMFP domain-containing protein YqiC
MSMAADITVEILKDIREEMRGVRTELEKHTDRFGVVERALLDLAEQQRFVVRYTKAISERDTRLEPRVSGLEARVEKLESK